MKTTTRTIETVTVEVEMLAFMEGQIRPVEIPVGEWLQAETEIDALELVFRYGQNEFQPKPFCSVSVGDVIRLRGDRWRVEGMGFAKLSTEVGQ